jgi:hypothetical protein
MLRHRRLDVRSIMLRACFAAVLLCAVPSTASASFVVYTGGLTEEAFWQAAVGASVLEDFESYADGTQISALPNLHLTFDELAGGGHPQAYLFSEGPPHGPTHLGNFPNGINEINQGDDIVTRPTSDFTLYALGFWNGDGQADTFVAYAYGASGELLGSVGAFKDSFGGFVSDVPVAEVRFDGNTGDGWNHLDGLQVNGVPEPSALILLGIGGACLLRWRRA